jgi:hypothetical protein
VELMGYFQLAEPGQPVQSVPGAGLEVPIWILGSSTYGAQLAAILGLPFAFASHFAPAMMMEAMATYRARFRPSVQLAAPYVMLGVNITAAETDAEAGFLFSSLQQSFLNMRSGRPGKLPPPVEGLDAMLAPYAREMMADCWPASWRRATVRDGLDAFVRRTNADELMVTAIFDRQAEAVVRDRGRDGDWQVAAAHLLQPPPGGDIPPPPPCGRGLKGRPVPRTSPPGSELIGALAPPLMESHLLVRFAIGDRPMTHAGGVARLPAFIFERQDDRHEGLLRWLPSSGIGIGEDQSLVRHDIEIDPCARHVVAVRATHDDRVGAARPHVEFRMRRRPGQRGKPLLQQSCIGPGPI